MSYAALPPKLALKVRYLATSSLAENPGNARTHPKAQIAKLKKAITQFGFVSPIIIDEQRMILAGHGRHRAALELDLPEVPTIMLQDMSKADVRAFVLADNIIADKAGYDKAILRSELQYLADVGYEVEITGLDTIEIDSILAIDMEDPPTSDDIVALPGKGPPITRLGDLWHIGPHRLLVGDARDQVAVERLMDGELAELVFTDPPYGCVIANNVSGLGKVGHDNFVMGAGQESLSELATTILRPAFRNVARHCRAGAIAFVCSDWRAAPHMLDAAAGVFEEVKNWIIWVKTNAGLGTFYRSQFEIILAFKMSAGKTINNFGLGEGGRHRSNVWTYAGANTFRAGRMRDLIDHPTCKPRKLVADAILDCSRRGGIVLDVFAGSGTTIVAAAGTGRRGYMIATNPTNGRVMSAMGRKRTLGSCEVAGLIASLHAVLVGPGGNTPLCLPPTAKRLEQVDLRIGNARVRFGYRCFGVRGCALCIKQFERADVALALTGARDPRRSLRLFARGTQCVSAIKRLLVAG